MRRGIAGRIASAVGGIGFLLALDSAAAHGCVWHRHIGCRSCAIPKTRAAFWAAKFNADVERDRHNAIALEPAEWTVATIWECETKKPDALRADLADILSKAAGPNACWCFADPHLEQLPASGAAGLADLENRNASYGSIIAIPVLD